MKLSVELHDNDIIQGAPDYDNSEYILREASRGVVIASDGSIYLLHVTRHNYHKLPGGGLDPGEDAAKAFARECMEEIGCQVEVTHDLGRVTEYRHEFNQRQVSYCFLAQQVGEPVEPKFEEDEIAAGFEPITVANIDEAIRVLEGDEPNNYAGKYMRARDFEILKAAKTLVS
jgi:8-oxo-dGTP pyrophosphatase MutT (NUDIX family)